MKTTKTAKGWVIERHGMLEQGGVCGRRVLYTLATLDKHNIGHNDDPTADFTGNGISTAAWLIHSVSPDRVLRKGHVIQ